MATGGQTPQKTQVRQFPMIDEWSIKEKLALASQVQRGGDQNWFSVSRALRSLLGDERPDETKEKVVIEDDKGNIVEKPVTSWFEKKNCARQYQDLLEKVQENKPKTSGRSNRRGSDRSGRDGTGSVETDGETIVKELTQKRRDEIQQLIAKEQERLREIQEEIDIANGPDPPEELMKMIWERMVAEDKEKKLKEEKNRDWLKEREAKFIDATRRYRPGTKSVPSSPRTPGTTVITVTSKPDGQSPSKDGKPQGLSVVLIDTSSGQDAQVAASPGQNPPPSSSPLLTSLLQNPPEKSPDSKSIPPGLTLGQPPPKGSPTKASPTKGQHGTRSAFFDPSSALASAAARQFTQSGSTSPGPSQPGSGTNTPRSISPAKSQSGVDVHTASPTLSKLLEIPISNVSGGNKLPPLPVIERIPRSSIDSQDGMKDSETIRRQVKEELLTEDESANDGQPESAQEDQGMQVDAVDETSSSIPGEGEDSSLSGNVGRSPRASKLDVAEDRNKSTPQTRRSARMQGRGSTSKVLVPVVTTPSVQAPPPPPLTAKPAAPDTPATPSSVSTPTAPMTRRSTRVRTKLESEGDNSNHPPSESSKARASVSEADQSTMDATAAPDSELISEESLESMPATSVTKLEHVPGIVSSVTGHMSTSTKRGPSSLLDSVPNSPASSNYGGNNEETKDWRKWQRDMFEKLKTVRTHQLAGEFLAPVKLKGYDEIVKRPMDLTAIRHKLQNGEIRTMAEFKRDIMLVFINATMYNASEIEVHQDALEVLKEFLIDIEEYEKTCPAVIVPPSSGRSSAAGLAIDQQTTGQSAASGDVKGDKVLEKKPPSEGRTTPTPKRTLPQRRRGDSSSILSESKDSDATRSSRRVRGVSTDTDPGAPTVVSTTPAVTSLTTVQVTPLSSTGTPSAPKTRSKKQ